MFLQLWAFVFTSIGICVVGEFLIPRVGKLYSRVVWEVIGEVVLFSCRTSNIRWKVLWKIRSVAMAVSKVNLVLIGSVLGSVVYCVLFGTDAYIIFTCGKVFARGAATIPQEVAIGRCIYHIAKGTLTVTLNASIQI